MNINKLRYGYSIFILPACIFLQSCGVRAQPVDSPLIDLYASPAAVAWLEPAYTCARQNDANLRITNSDEADIILQIDESASLASPAYQIGMEEVMVAANKDSILTEMELEQTRSLFAGQGDPSIQVWVYPAGYDLQVAFDRQVMAGRPVSSKARLSVSPEQVADLINTQPDVVGILTREWMPAEARVIFNLGQVPVLAITKPEAQDVIQEIIDCLQK